MESGFCPQPVLTWKKNLAHEMTEKSVVELEIEFMKSLCLGESWTSYAGESSWRCSRKLTLFGREK